MAVRSVIFFVAASALVATEAAPQDPVEEFLDTALPEVDFFMQESKDLSKEFTAQAELMKEQVAANEKEKKEALNLMKTSFELNLTDQALRSDQIVNDSVILAALISTEESRIATLRADSSKLQKSNDIMRRALDGLKSKVRLASAFLVDSLRVSDDSNETELEVLRPTTPQPTLEHFLETMGDHKVSLLGVAAAKKSLKSKKDEPKAEFILDTLPKHLVDLAEAGEQGEAQLHARFLAFYELGAAKQAELLAHKEQLQQDLDSKEALTAQLLGVKEHLFEIKTGLTERIKGMRAFAARGDDLATSSLEKAATAFEPSTY